ncbi:flagellar hook-length control protein FliK [Nocardioides yefusunii]|uniref:Flagellar hook-length control protein FliK n=1 Tax=Nocardioides yefusunii TaxID=2500546 RepID=A0ABW1QX32_9ACTN|nr:flagellar hook-length control protein FliK [Nocardioides yefusunii]
MTIPLKVGGSTAPAATSPRGSGSSVASGDAFGALLSGAISSGSARPEAAATQASQPRSERSTSDSPSTQPALTTATRHDVDPDAAEGTTLGASGALAGAFTTPFVDVAAEALLTGDDTALADDAADAVPATDAENAAAQAAPAALFPVLTPASLQLAAALRAGGTDESGAVTGALAQSPTTDGIATDGASGSTLEGTFAPLLDSATAAGPDDADTGTGGDTGGTLIAPDTADAPQSPAVSTVPVAAAATTGVDVSTLTPVSGIAGASVTGTATGPDATAATEAAAPRADHPPVADQVGSQVSRLVSRGDGTHRLTMTLTPEHLGDVRVTLVVRNGEMTVSFGAGDEARRALLESAPELRRLLELAGATSTKVDVDEFDGTGQGWAAAADQGDGSEDGADTGSDHAAEDLHARTRGGTDATDGNPSGTGTGRPLDNGTPSRSAGLDVTV